MCAAVPPPFALTPSTLLPQRNFSQAVLSSRLGSSVPRSHPEHNQSPCEGACAMERFQRLQQPGASPAHPPLTVPNQRLGSVHGWR